jgi:hypothetical protein
LTNNFPFPYHLLKDSKLAARAAKGKIMDSSTTQTGLGPSVAPEFGAWPIEGNTLTNVNNVRIAFNTLLETISPMFVKGNERYLSIVKTKLEEACLMTVKGIAKPSNGGHA